MLWLSSGVQDILTRYKDSRRLIYPNLEDSPTVGDRCSHHRSSPLSWRGRFIKRSESILGILLAFRDRHRDTFGSEQGRCRRRAWVSYVGLVELLSDYGHPWPRCKIISFSPILSILIAVNRE